MTEAVPAENVHADPRPTAPAEAADLSSVVEKLHALMRQEHRSLRARVAEWLGEIFIVFVGVYAAFLLNAWQTQRQDRGNHLLILQSLDTEISESVENLKQGVAASRKSLDQFEHQLSAGEMPALHLLMYATDYDPADDVALSQAGADHLLKFQTVEALKKVSSVAREGFMLLRNRQQLSYELIAPRLDDPKETFYDPQTKQLKPMFAWYLAAQRETDEFMRDSLAANEALLAQVRAERASLR